ncbi:hypothetical protein D9M71_841540 [compost metagenome]
MGATAAKVVATRQELGVALDHLVGTQLFNALAQTDVVVQFEQSLSQGNSDLVGVQRHLRLEQRLAGLVLLADDDRC